MRIKFTEHAVERAKQRGASIDEVEEVILRGRSVEAKKGRKAKEMVFDYGKEWLGRDYPQKKIQVIYIEEGDWIIIITVKVFYGHWR